MKQILPISFASQIFRIRVKKEIDNGSWQEMYISDCIHYKLSLHKTVQIKLLNLLVLLIFISVEWDENFTRKEEQKAIID